MTPTEARAKLLSHNFFSIWQTRHLIGGSHYKPGNPGVFEGIRFFITLISEGVYTAKVIDFGDQEKELQPNPDIRDLANGQKKDLEWAVNAVLNELWSQLDNIMRGTGPNVPLGAVLEASREHPDAKSELELLTRMVFMDAATEAGYRGALEKIGYRVYGSGEDCSERALAVAYGGGDADSPKLVWPVEKAPPAQLGKGGPTAAPSKNIVSYRRNDKSVATMVPAEFVKDVLGSRRDFHWAPLSEKDSWPTALRPVGPFMALSKPHEMTTVLFMSAARQILEKADEWLDLVFFSTEPVDGKLTACFLGTKADVAKRPKPRWLIELGNDAEKEAWAAT